MLRWYPSALLRVVLELTFLPILFCTILCVNCAADASTPWRLGPWGGPGTTGDFWKLALVLALGWTMLVLGWRGAKTLFKVLLVAWHLGLCAVLVALFVDNGGLVLQGASIGLRVSLGLLAPLTALATIVCAGIWIAQDLRRGHRARSVSPLQRRNKLALVVAVVTVVAGAVGFAFDQEELGAVLSAAGMFACHEVMRPLNPSEELRKAMVLEGSAPN